jgi:nucleotide-binding universal stress UspA family protein
VEEKSSMILEGVTVIGAVIAVAYVASITSILWWMLHVPAAGDIEQHVGRITRESTQFSRIVVPVQGDVLSDRLVALASQMAKFRGATMDVLYIVEVPLTLPINAVSEDQKVAAEDTFKRATRIADRYNVTINKRMQAARQAGPTIVQYARDHNADLLLLGDVPKVNRRGTMYARSVEYVFEHAPCEVLIDRPPMEFRSQPA